MVPTFLATLVVTLFPNSLSLIIYLADSSAKRFKNSWRAITTEPLTAEPLIAEL
jgi:hypothetical protein